jgi:hypothetical protein
MSLCLSTSAKNNGSQLDKVHTFQHEKNDDPLLLHGLRPSDVVLPREQPPLADLCEIVFPEDRGPPEGRPFTDPEGDRIAKLPLPPGKAIVTHAWNDLCPDASVVVVSSGDGHEFALVKLYKADRILVDAISEISGERPTTEIRPPLAGRMSGYNPMSGEDYAAGDEILPDGHFFIHESSASLVPKGRDAYSSLKLNEVRIHKFKQTPANEARFRMSGTKKDKELQIDDDGGSFRSKAVSGIFYIREGVEGGSDPRTMANIYGIRRESWTPIGLAFPSTAAPKEAKKLLGNFDVLYGERAVPFPTLVEVASAMPSRARVAEQLETHRRRLIELGRDDARQKVETELAAASSKEKSQLQGDLALIAEDKDGVRIHEKLHKALIVLSGPVVGLDLESYEDVSE